MNIEQNYKKWLDSLKDSDLLNQMVFMTEPEIYEAFYKELEFGTGGLRGIMGAGTNCMNIYTVNKATQGLCNFLKSQKEPFSVAIAFDSRINSELFARCAASVVAANGGMAHIFQELMPTPILSYGVRSLGCDAGIVITASHNPAEYNGYKVYGSDGCQITLQAADLIQRYIQEVDVFNDVRTEPFEKAFIEGSISYIYHDLLAEYFEQAKQCSVNPGILAESDIKVTYTPLNGTGNKPVREILAKAGLRNLIIVPEQENPDGLFPTCQSPNPEEHCAFELAMGLAERTDADLLIATDPDCDRVGIAVKSGNAYVLLTGNETGCLLLNYILSQKKKKNSLPENPVLIKTIVTSRMANMIAIEYGVRVIDTLTGFKFIGEQIGLLEQAHEEDGYIFGFEESYGYLPETFVRDKDAVLTSLLICEMTAFYKKNNSTLIEELNKLYEKHGYWKHKLLTFTFEGSNGLKRMKVIIDRFRNGTFGDFADLKITKSCDYLSSITTIRATHETGGLFLPKSDVLVFSLEDNCEIVLRPSGTEPKLKCYLTATSDNEDTSAKMLDALETDFSSKLKLLEGCG
ncbi:MAG: phosphoglucomutase [Firmicutes bacterium HGW-Firmicutes-16]|nr:MAG: phosphoglucomutase [Firmicutes bacterium HGW-Firmicutes-16]